MNAHPFPGERIPRTSSRTEPTNHSRPRKEADLQFHLLDLLPVSSPYLKKVGAFEGAGYASKGLYRPSLDCIMFSKGTKPFCPACRQAVERVIEYHGE